MIDQGFPRFMVLIYINTYVQRKEKIKSKLANSLDGYVRQTL